MRNGREGKLRAASCCAVAPQAAASNAIVITLRIAFLTSASPHAALCATSPKTA
jgi:hypothetical protein